MTPASIKERFAASLVSDSRVRTKSNFVRKPSYKLLLPTFELDNTWKGAPEVLKRYYFALGYKISFIGLNHITQNAQFTLCVARSNGNGTVDRFKLWDNGGALYYPVYGGQKIGDGFYLEIWSTNNPTITNDETIELFIAKWRIPSCLCDQTDTEIEPTCETTDVLFDLDGFNPGSDSFIVGSACDVTAIDDSLFYLVTTEGEKIVTTESESVILSI